MCSKELKYSIGKKGLTKIKDFSMRQECIVYNSNGTQIHRGSTKRGLNIHIMDNNLRPEDAKMNVLFYDPETTKNSSQALYLQDLDYEGGSLPPGEYEYMLEMTKIEKLGHPYRSNCTKKKSIGDKHHSKYSYTACLDKCMADIILDKCGEVPDAFQNYVTENRIINGGNESLQCFSKMFREYLDDTKLLGLCNCQQPCTQIFYTVTRNLVSSHSEREWMFRIRFKSGMVNIIKEHPLYRIEELISQVGGSCGLFLGMSLLSVVEIIFHAAISFIQYCIRKKCIVKADIGLY